MGKRKRPLPRWLQRPQYWAIRAALTALLAGEVGPNIRAAAALGRTFGGLRLNRKRLQRAIDNLSIAFPDWDEDRRREFALRSYEHIFMVAVEAAYTPRMLTGDGWGGRVRLGELGAAIGPLLSGRPCVLISGHCGNWELVGYMMAVLGFPIHALYRPLDLRPLDEYVRRTRGEHGMYLVDKFGAIKTLPVIMDRGEMAGFVADQNAGDRGLFVPYFGRLASTYKTIGLLAMQFEAPIICGVARRIGFHADEMAPGSAPASAANTPSTINRRQTAPATSLPPPVDEFQYVIDAQDVILPEEWKGQPDPVFYITARYRRAIEGMVRRAPEQYLWMHRVWKSRPRHERLGRPFPASLREKLRQLPWMTDDELARIEEWSRRDTLELAKNGPPAREEPEPAEAEAF